MILMHLSGAYLPQNFYKDKAEIMDCRDIVGTNGYCDETAKRALRKRIQNNSFRDIHFLDSGNYHYLSLLWMEKIQEPFALVLFDHHPDMQPAAFGEITSCGGWVKELLETNSNVQRVYMVGVDEKLFYQLPLHDRVTYGWDEKSAGNLPLYISFDKDVFCKQDACCDWEQGNMKAEEALSLLKEIAQNHELLGMDVCGEDSRWEQNYALQKIVETNDRMNRLLLEFWEQKK